MNPRFFFMPVAALTCVHPAFATAYLNREQAQMLMFPGATFTANFRNLTDVEIAAIEKAGDVNVLNKQLKVWKVSAGGWFFADQVVGKHEYIPFALGLDENGTVKDIEILEYREAYGSEVTNPKWRAQFTGKNHDSQLKLSKDIQNLSGATLSSKQVTDDVRRLIVAYALLLAGR